MGKFKTEMEEKDYLCSKASESFFNSNFVKTKLLSVSEEDIGQLKDYLAESLTNLLEKYMKVKVDHFTSDLSQNFIIKRKY